MKAIPSTRGFVVLVDDEDAEPLSQFRWHAHRSILPNGREHFRPARRQRIDGICKTIYLVHHIIRAPLGHVVDHINGDPWDNRRENLRICTQAENARNRKRRTGTRSPYKGTYSRKRRDGTSWYASITLNGRTRHLGTFSSAEEAARAYDEEAVRLHGAYARLNFPRRAAA